MTKLIAKLSLAAALCGGIFSVGACSSASTNTVSTGNTNATAPTANASGERGGRER